MSNIIERKPVVNGDEVVEKKQTLTEVLGCSPMSVVMSSFTKQFLIPKMKGFIFEGITYILSTFLNGGTNSISSATSNIFAKPFTPYSQFSQSTVTGASSFARQSVPSEPFSNWQYTTMEAANEVLKKMTDELINYNKVTVLSYYEYSGKTAPWTADKWGWRSLSGVQAVPSAGGWILNLPDPQPVV